MILQDGFGDVGQAVVLMGYPTGIEAILARTDDSGAPLRAECRYRIEGLPPPARWWSITAYARDLFLFPNALGRYSLNSATAQLDAKGRFVLVTGPVQPDGPEFWLPTPKSGALVLTLRLYNPDAGARRRRPRSPSPSTRTPAGSSRGRGRKTATRCGAASA
jgi:hypothetical protein